MSETGNNAQNKLIAAIAGVMETVGKIGKDNFNKFDKYKFTSIDDFMSATSKACASHGVVVIQNEVSREVISKKTSRGEASWLMLDFCFDVHHSEGGSITGLKRSVAVPFTGAQAFGSAQSYALKQFMRSLFQIATGDADDPDSAPTPPAATVPDIPPAPISEDKYAELVATAEKMDAFPDAETFKEWIEKTCGKKLYELSATEGDSVSKFLLAKPNPEAWPELHRQVLAELTEVSE